MKLPKRLTVLAALAVLAIGPLTACSQEIGGVSDTGEPTAEMVSATSRFADLIRDGMAVELAGIDSGVKFGPSEHRSERLDYASVTADVLAELYVGKPVRAYRFESGSIYSDIMTAWFEVDCGKTQVRFMQLFGHDDSTWWPVLGADEGTITTEPLPPEKVPYGGYAAPFGDHIPAGKTYFPPCA